MSERAMLKLHNYAKLQSYYQAMPEKYISHLFAGIVTHAEHL